MQLHRGPRSLSIQEGCEVPFHWSLKSHLTYRFSLQLVCSQKYIGAFGLPVCVPLASKRYADPSTLEPWDHGYRWR